MSQATHTTTGFIVAIKIYDKTSKNATRIREVRREVVALKQICHENLPALFDVIESPNQLYLVQELVEGQNLQEYLKHSKKALSIGKEDSASSRGASPAKPSEYASLPEQKCMSIIRQVLAGLSYLHTRQLCHRDIKLENIMYKES